MNAAALSSAIRPASSATSSSAVSSTMGSFFPKELKRWRHDNQKSDGDVPKRMRVSFILFFLLTLWLLDAGLFFCASCLLDIGR
jgi:hypothetical protein